MSSPILPSAGRVGTSEVVATPQDAAPSSPASATIAEGLQLQGVAIDKAIQNAPATSGQICIDPVDPSSPVVLGPANLAALQLKSASQWQADCDAEVTATPPVKDISVNKSQVVTGTSASDAAGEMSHVSAAPATPSPEDTLSLFQAWPFQNLFGMVLGMDSFLGSMSWMLPSWLQPNTSYGQRDPDPHTHTRNTETVRKWMEQLIIGGQVTNVIAEEFMTTIETVSSNRVTGVTSHTFTQEDVGKALFALQDKGLLPPEIPDKETIINNIAKSALDTIDKLNKRFGATDAGSASEQ